MLQPDCAFVSKSLQEDQPCVKNVACVSSYPLALGPDAEEYKMDHLHRGKVIIFNHEKFDSDMEEDRIGTSVDREALENTFGNLGFHVIPQNDLTVDEIRDTLDTASKYDYTDRDCLVVVVLTHGAKGGILSARDRTYHRELLVSYFTANRCPSLAGKPKIFIIQACRGKFVSQGFEVEESVQCDSAFIKSSPSYCIPEEADILLAFSTYEGRKAHRDPDSGSWFIQQLCKDLVESPKNTDMLSLLTKVARHVAIGKEYQGAKQIPVIQSTLTRKLFLSPPLQAALQPIESDLPVTHRWLFLSFEYSEPKTQIKKSLSCNII